MALTKHEIPILEYDDNPRAVLMPNRKNLYHFPEYAVFPFLEDEIDRFAAEHNCTKIGETVTVTKTYPIYEHLYKGKKIALCQAPLGSSAAVQSLDFLIGYGCTKIISAGSCGALVDLPENEFLVPVEALRDEGTSYHYLPPSRTVTLNERAVRAIETALRNNGVSYHKCKTWTTDGFYRETKDMVEYRKEEGCSVVEMECAGLAACAQFRGVTFGQMLYTADSLANVEAHDDRGWGEGSMSAALKLCLDAVVDM